VNGQSGRHVVQVQHRLDLAAALHDKRLSEPMDPVQADTDALGQALAELGMMIATKRGMP
jgi:hypothetical protein